MEGAYGTQKEHYGLRRVKARKMDTENLYIFFGIHTANAVLLAERLIERQEAEAAYPEASDGLESESSVENSRLMAENRHEIRAMKPGPSDEKYKMTSWKQWKTRDDFQTTQIENINDNPYSMKLPDDYMTESSSYFNLVCFQLFLSKEIYINIANKNSIREE